jgi:predicted ATP-dependent endonuclease of OLD family
MPLERVEIDNFRAIRHLDLTLDPSLTVLLRDRA